MASKTEVICDGENCVAPARKGEDQYQCINDSHGMTFQGNVERSVSAQTSMYFGKYFDNGKNIVWTASLLVSPHPKADLCLKCKNKLLLAAVNRLKLELETEMKNA